MRAAQGPYPPGALIVEAGSIKRATRKIRRRVKLASAELLLGMRRSQSPRSTATHTPSLRRRRHRGDRHRQAQPFLHEHTGRWNRIVLETISATVGPPTPASRADVVVIGGGHSALSVAYCLRRTTLIAIVLDYGESAAGRVATYVAVAPPVLPAEWSSLSGRLSLGGSTHYRTATKCSPT